MYEYPSRKVGIFYAIIAYITLQYQYIYYGGQRERYLKAKGRLRDGGEGKRRAGG